MGWGGTHVTLWLKQFPNLLANPDKGTGTQRANRAVLGTAAPQPRGYLAIGMHPHRKDGGVEKEGGGGGTLWAPSPGGGGEEGVMKSPIVWGGWGEEVSPLLSPPPAPALWSQR